MYKKKYPAINLQKSIKLKHLRKETVELVRSDWRCEKFSINKDLPKHVFWLDVAPKRVLARTFSYFWKLTPQFSHDMTSIGPMSKKYEANNNYTANELQLIDSDHITIRQWPNRKSYWKMST